MYLSLDQPPAMGNNVANQIDSRSECELVLSHVTWLPASIPGPLHEKEMKIHGFQRQDILVFRKKKKNPMKWTLRTAMMT